MTKVVVICNQVKYDLLKMHKNDIGFTIALKWMLSKINVEVVVCAIPLNLVVDTVKKALYTGYPGDGKIILYDVENVICVSTLQIGLVKFE